MKCFNKDCEEYYQCDAEDKYYKCNEFKQWVLKRFNILLCPRDKKELNLDKCWECPYFKPGIVDAFSVCGKICEIQWCSDCVHYATCSVLDHIRNHKKYDDYKITSKLATVCYLNKKEGMKHEISIAEIIKRCYQCKDFNESWGECKLKHDFPEKCEDYKDK